MMRPRLCPLCLGTGKIGITAILPTHAAIKKAYGKHRKYPLDYYCSKCDRPVTRSHRFNYPNCKSKIFVIKK